MNNDIIKDAMHALQIEQLTPLQQETIRVATDIRDLIVLSPTGSGKTLAYLLPLLIQLENREKSKGISTLILVPSRELALQVSRVFSSMKSGHQVLCAYGGHSLLDEKNALLTGNPEILIGTPGRILDHLDRGNINTDSIELLIIDEFDKALELGFQEDMSAIIAFMTSLRRRILLSATDADEIPKFTGVNRVLKLNYLDDNKDLEVRLDLLKVVSPQKDKLDTLLNLLCTLGAESSIVFCNHRESVDRTVEFLKRNGVACAAFHGGLEQDWRERSLFKFANGSVFTLVATDLAARGLDIPEVEHVIHYHLPLDQDAFTHRNGRTARWEAKGSSYLILHEEEALPSFIDVEVKELPLPESVPAPAEVVWTTLYIGKGKKDKLNVIDIVGYMHKVAKLEKHELGKISVKDHLSFVAVKSELAALVLKRCANEKIKGMKTIIEEAY